MKTNIIITSAALVLFASTAFATVGGPTTVYDLRYDAKNSTVLYTWQSFGGKGCPPELKSVSIIDNTTKDVVPCLDDGSSQEIQAITNNLPFLSPVHLRKNNISITIEQTAVEYWDGVSEVLKRSFIASIFQNNKKIASIPFTGCNLDQPLIVDGYSIPGMNNKLAFLFSTKGDCFEGGYTYETVHVVSGLVLAEGTEVNVYKPNTSLAPHEGSLVVYPTSTENKFPLTSVAVGLVVFILGGLVSLIFRKR